MSGSPSLRTHSVDVILENQHPSGAYIASPNFGVYHYSWFRDGAFIAEAMRVAGESASAARFHDWAARVLIARAPQMQELVARSEAGDVPGPEEHLHCRYNLDGSTSLDDWTNFQLDGFGTWLWAVARFHDVLAPEHIRAAVNAVVPYIVHFWDTPSYDWWEESAGHVHVSSIGCIAAGLEAISSRPWIDADTRHAAALAARDIRAAIDRSGLVDGRLRKWLAGDGIDSSVLALIDPMRLIEPSSDVARATVAAVRDQLALPGVHRHLDDTYFGGGQWLLLTAMLGLCELAQGERGLAQSRLDWIEARAEADLSLPEQVSEHLLHPEFEAEWVQRWGAIASPLLWSHAMYLLLHDALEENQ